MELTGSDFDRIRREHLRGVRRHDFALLWLAAEQRADALKARRREDSYLAGVVSTCRWIANAGVTFDEPIDGRHGESARSPIGCRSSSAIEELIESEASEAERLSARGWDPPGMPGYVAGVTATFAWTWRRSHRPPIEVSGLLAG
ncbi:hypothetical protein [Kribbella sindirgiensis]|uniref:Uncharacterized protein n=1 Tax=Kribbella sindirgiensis TaxID=1124744 RepID=A0A4R0IUG5_9ACTN|nr:hypothetical protein [Kribbella sindirgiensis]TCC35088.1 hypothetical protein E0H50_14565 [Kribbella sindirgiensis]